MAETAPPWPDREGGVSLLLAHHGTAGARRAEPLALELARLQGARVCQLLVVPEFWSEMLGDDWLNNASTRDEFGAYVEKLLSREAAREIQGVRERCQAAGLEHLSLLRQGDPTDALIDCVREIQPVMVVIGPRRPAHFPGLHSRMRIPELLRGLTVPLVIAPWR
ncbi:MAG: universal stress protein [Magnetococcales bacterium]|nr:universal stress protein [Magnetococcales bacterium]